MLHTKLYPVCEQTHYDVGGNRSHLVPLVGWGAEAVRKLDRLSDSVDGPGWLFPGRRTLSMISEGIQAGHADVGLLNDYLGVPPGANFSPHCVRYAFSTYGERDLGFHKSEAKVILDHIEGMEPDCVIYQARTILRRWPWLHTWGSLAILQLALKMVGPR